MLYHIALFTHVLGALGLFIAVGLIFAALFGMRRAGTVEQFREWAGLASTTKKLMPLTAVFILLPGVYMVLTAWGWQSAWTDVALGAVLLMLTSGSVFIDPRLAALHKAASAAPDGLVPHALRARLFDRLLWTTVFIFTGVLLGIVFLMTTKPALVGALITLVITALLGLAAALLLWRGQQASKDGPHQQVQTVEGGSSQAS